jgi:TPR repeat protein
MHTIIERAALAAVLAAAFAAVLPGCGRARDDGQQATTTARSAAGPVGSASFTGPAPHDGFKMPNPPAQATWRAQNLPTELQLIQDDCDRGQLKSCVRLGDHLLSDKTIQQDPALAAWLFYDACEKGEPTGCLYLGFAHVTGKGVEQAGGAAAAPVFARACNDKESAGCMGLGILYMNGSGVPKDDARSRYYFQRACDGGDEKGCKMAKR